MKQTMVRLSVVASLIPVLADAAGVPVKATCDSLSVRVYGSTDPTTVTPAGLRSRFARPHRQTRRTIACARRSSLPRSTHATCERATGYRGSTTTRV